MGILSWWKGDNTKVSTSSVTKPIAKATDSNAIVSAEKAPVTGMNGAVEVTRPGPEVDVTVFEFGSIAASSDKVTLAGYCPVSDDLEPCRWEILPAAGSDAPQFRGVVF